MLDALIYSSPALGSIVSNRIEVSSLLEKIVKGNSLIVSFADCAYKSRRKNPYPEPWDSLREDY